MHHSVSDVADPITGRYWTGNALGEQVRARAQSYRRQGMQPGDRVLIQHGNSLEFFADLLAVWSLSACAVPVDERLTDFETARLVEAAGARFRLAPECVSGGDIVLHDTMPDSAVAEQSVSVLSPVRERKFSRLDDEALILFTSGSTGNPKGVVHTHRSLQARWLALRTHLGLSDFERTLCVLPTNFGHGLICNCLFPLLNGCQLFIAPPFKPDLAMGLGALIDRHKITFLSSVPSMWGLVLRASAQPEQGSLRRVHIGSAPLSAVLWSQIQDWSRVSSVCNAYGITETGSWTAGLEGTTPLPEEGLVGSPWGAEIRISEARSTQDFVSSQPLAEGREGMVWLNTPALMKGYLNRDDLTDSAIADGWFMTGDIGLVDRRGWLYLKGRERDEINKGGMKIYPGDVDGVFAAHPDVLDSCTFAVDDSVYGQNVATALVLRQCDARTINSIHGHVGSMLGAHKRPVRWYVVETLPRTERGKLDRKRIANLCEPLVPLDLRRLLGAASNGTIQ